MLRPSSCCQNSSVQTPNSPDPDSAVAANADNTFTIATYNIHKGVQGIGPLKRLEIHNLLHAVEQFDADVVCLQEVQHSHKREQARFAHWPAGDQANYLAPEGYRAIYRSNAITPHGEHGNALLSRWPVLSHQHEDMSDHRFEQRGLLHGVVQVHGRDLHVIVVHLGLIAASRVRQVAQLLAYIARDVPSAAPLVVAGDFNDWGSTCMRAMQAAEMRPCPTPAGAALATFPSRFPLAQLDRIYARGLRPVGQQVPRGPAWARMSDHLPLLAQWAFID
ncbi:MAG: endonuclease/exonuclease/phosphatase family protein [Burkholderiaceae bacterium]